MLTLIKMKMKVILAPINTSKAAVIFLGYIFKQ